MDGPESLSPFERRDLLNRCDIAMSLCQVAEGLTDDETRRLTVDQAIAILKRS